MGSGNEPWHDPNQQADLGEEEHAAVEDVLTTGMLTDASYEGGKYVRAFEGKVARLLGVKHVVAVNSGTAALHASLLAMGVKQGDEVVIPSFTFVATANVVLHAARSRCSSTLLKTTT